MIHSISITSDLYNYTNSQNYREITSIRQEKSIKLVCTTFELARAPSCFVEAAHPPAPLAAAAPASCPPRLVATLAHTPPATIPSPSRPSPTHPSRARETTDRWASWRCSRWRRAGRRGAGRGRGRRSSGAGGAGGEERFGGAGAAVRAQHPAPPGPVVPDANTES
jgi:hypothetical protein